MKVGFPSPDVRLVCLLFQPITQQQMSILALWLHPVPFPLKWIRRQWKRLTALAGMKHGQVNPFASEILRGKLLEVLWTIRCLPAVILPEFQEKIFAIMEDQDSPLREQGAAPVDGPCKIIKPYLGMCGKKFRVGGSQRTKRSRCPRGERKNACKRLRKRPLCPPWRLR
jgi:hypothetical protein